MRYQHAKQAPLSGHWIDTVWHPTRINLRDPGSVPPLIGDRSWIWLRSEFLQLFSFSGNIPQRYFWYSQCTLYSSDSSARSCSPWLWPKQCLAAKHHTGVSFVELIARGHTSALNSPLLSVAGFKYGPTFPYHVPLQLDIYIYIYIYTHMYIYIWYFYSNGPLILGASCHWTSFFTIGSHSAPRLQYLVLVQNLSGCQTWPTTGTPLGTSWDPSILWQAASSQKR